MMRLLIQNPYYIIVTRLHRRLETYTRNSDKSRAKIRKYCLVDVIYNGCRSTRLARCCSACHIMLDLLYIYILYDVLAENDYVDFQGPAYAAAAQQI